MVRSRDASLGHCCAGLRSIEQVLDPFRFILFVLAGWVNQQQQDINGYLKEENRVLREQLRNKRLLTVGNQLIARWLFRLVGSEVVRVANFVAVAINKLR